MCRSLCSYIQVNLPHYVMFMQRLLDTLSHDDVEVRRRLSEMTRKVTVLRVNEKALTRRYQTMEEVQGTLRKVITRSESETDSVLVCVFVTLQPKPHKYGKGRINAVC